MTTFDKLKENLDSESLIACVFDTARHIDDNQELFWRLRHLGRISSLNIVDNSNKTQTACIYQTGTRYNIEINSHFLRNFIDSEHALLWIIMHELLHKTRGDLNKTIQTDLPVNIAKFFINLAQDIVINASLHHSYFSKVHSLHKKLYKEAIFPVNMLAPLEVLYPDAPKNMNYLEQSIIALKPGIEKFIKQVHTLCDIYNIPKYSFNPDINEFTSKAAKIYAMGWWVLNPLLFNSLLESIVNLFKKYVKDNNIWKILELIFTGTIFIGNHNDKIMTFRFPNNFNEKYRNKYTVCKRLFNENIDKEDTDKENYYELKKAIKNALIDSPKNNITINELTQETSVIPFIGRRETFLIHSGYTPVFYPNTIYNQKNEEKGVSVYFDVSGSMFNDLPLFFDLLNYVQELIITPIWEFSTKIVPVQIQDIEDRVIKSTGGTSINCVLQHVIQHQYNKILIITDGEVESIEEIIYQQCKQKLNITVVFPNCYKINSPLIELVGGEKSQGKNWFVLPKQKFELNSF